MLNKDEIHGFVQSDHSVQMGQNDEESVNQSNSNPLPEKQEKKVSLPQNKKRKSLSRSAIMNSEKSKPRDRKFLNYYLKQKEKLNKKQHLFGDDLLKRVYQHYLVGSKDPPNQTDTSILTRKRKLSRISREQMQMDVIQKRDMSRTLNVFEQQE